MIKIGIIGAGTYGCYIAKCVSDKFKCSEVHLFEVGDNKLKNETEIGFKSEVKGNNYAGLSKGRYFGLGGTSNKWGGQILTFSDVDFLTPNTFLTEIINLNIKYKRKVYDRLKIPLSEEDQDLKNGLSIKNGIWLSVLRRNLFKLLRVKKIRSVRLRSNTRVIKIERNTRTKKFSCIHFFENTQLKSEEFDFIFLASGAFESARILLSSGLIESSVVYFSDHISKEYCKVKGSTKIGKTDFIFRLKGLSLMTKRIIGEQDNCSFYLHPVFNLEFKFFKSIKEILFYREFSINKLISLFINAILEFPIVLSFIWKVLVEKKMYVKNNIWSLYLDIENPFLSNTITLKEEKYDSDIPSIQIEYQISNEAVKILNKIEKKIDDYLLSNNVNFEKNIDSLDANSYEDIYHPYGMYNFIDLADYETRWPGLLVVSTGVLPRAGGINPTAAIFPIIENFIENKLDI